MSGFCISSGKLTWKWKTEDCHKCRLSCMSRLKTMILGERLSNAFYAIELWLRLTCRCHCRDMRLFANLEVTKAIKSSTFFAHFLYKREKFFIKKIRDFDCLKVNAIIIEMSSRDLEFFSHSTKSYLHFHLYEDANVIIWYANMNDLLLNFFSI